MLWSDREKAAAVVCGVTEREAEAVCTEMQTLHTSVPSRRKDALKAVSEYQASGRSFPLRH